MHVTHAVPTGTEVQRLHIFTEVNRNIRDIHQLIIAVHHMPCRSKENINAYYIKSLNKCWETLLLYCNVRLIDRLTQQSIARYQTTSNVIRLKQSLS